MKGVVRVREMLVAGATFIAVFIPAAASAQEQGWLANALSLDEPEWKIGDITKKLGGTAAGTLFTSLQSAGPAYPHYDHQEASGEARTTLRAQRIFDTGLILGAGADFLLYRDKFSGDQYDNDTVEKVFLFVQTGFGRGEIGEQDGAGY